jgi:hypothetical protein
VKKNVLKTKETLWKNNLNFVKDVSIIYVNFITTVLTVTEKKKETLLLCHPLIHTGTEEKDISNEIR